MTSATKNWMGTAQYWKQTWAAIEFVRDYLSQKRS